MADVENAEGDDKTNNLQDAMPGSVQVEEKRNDPEDAGNTDSLDVTKANLTKAATDEFMLIFSFSEKWPVSMQISYLAVPMIMFFILVALAYAISDPAKPDERNLMVLIIAAIPYLIISFGTKTFHRLVAGSCLPTCGVPSDWPFDEASTVAPPTLNFNLYGSLLCTVVSIFYMGAGENSGDMGWIMFSYSMLWFIAMPMFCTQTTLKFGLTQEDISWIENVNSLAFFFSMVGISKVGYGGRGPKVGEWTFFIVCTIFLFFQTVVNGETIPMFYVSLSNLAIGMKVSFEVRFAVGGPAQQNIVMFFALINYCLITFGLYYYCREFLRRNISASCSFCAVVERNSLGMLQSKSDQAATQEAKDKEAIDAPQT